MPRRRPPPHRSGSSSTATNTPCDSDFFRTEITFVDHVRDRQTADVHLLMTGQPTGSGGREITFSFFGQGRLMGRDQVLRETFVVAASQDDIRRGMVRVMTLGLVPYVLDTAAAARLKVTLQEAAARTTSAPARDPWDRWSLRLNLNGNASGEASITLPREEATSEEVLVNRRQLATSYRYFAFFGVSYTFGSIFSPIVNPRFGG
jgi:hypothetical protein